MNGTFTATRTSTFTDARLRAVMPEVGADFYALACAQIISLATAQRWTEELTYILAQEAAHGFQIQLTCPNGQRIALDYRVSSDGSIHESGIAGGVDYYALPKGTYATLFVGLLTMCRSARGTQEQHPASPESLSESQSEKTAVTHQGPADLASVWSMTP